VMGLLPVKTQPLHKHANFWSRASQTPKATSSYTTQRRNG
jgi:hypothetical protein